MRFQAGVQIVLIIIAVVIVMTIVKPEFEEITVKQDQIAEYNDAVAKAGEYNDRLQQMVDKVESLPRTEVVKLERFLPEEIDSVRVARDIENIVKRNNLLVQKIDSSGPLQSGVTSVGQSPEQMSGGSLQAEAVRELTSETFTVSVIGSYPNMKSMLQDIERNAYPLRIMSLGFSSEGESLFYTFELELQAFALGSSQN